MLLPDGRDDRFVFLGLVAMMVPVREQGHFFWSRSKKAERLSIVSSSVLRLLATRYLKFQVRAILPPRFHATDGRHAAGGLGLQTRPAMPH